ncbi:MAG: hypothetical protein JWN74_471 [Acidobacteriaceae bacterium]|nr:hypothetical protein [Acidobacteriaceae bacterium]
MKFIFLYAVLSLAVPAFGQKTLPELKDGTVIDEKMEFRHDGPLLISGRVKLRGISLDLRGPITVASGADLDSKMCISKYLTRQLRQTARAISAALARLRSPFGSQL